MLYQHKIAFGFLCEILCSPCYFTKVGRHEIKLCFFFLLLMLIVLSVICSDRPEGRNSSFEFHAIHYVVVQQNDG